MSTSIDIDDVAGFTMELSEREIYNDIRAQCDITEILTIRPDSTPEYFSTERVDEWVYDVPPQSTIQVRINAPTDHIMITWLDIEWTGSVQTLIDLTEEACLAIHPDAYWRWNRSHTATMCSLPTSEARWSCEIIGSDDAGIDVELTSGADYLTRGRIRAHYIAVTPDTRYITLRSTDETSIAKYGRRVYNMIWSLGQTPTAMQARVDSYLDKYKNAVIMAILTLRGLIDADIDNILDLDISSIVHAHSTKLNMNELFYINNIVGTYVWAGILEAVYQLEQVRGSETHSIFTLDISFLDGDDYLG